jgi:hypothetical protein
MPRWDICLLSNSLNHIFGFADLWTFIEFFGSDVMMRLEPSGPSLSEWESTMINDATWTSWFFDEWMGIGWFPHNVVPYYCQLLISVSINYVLVGILVGL